MPDVQGIPLAISLEPSISGPYGPGTNAPIAESTAPGIDVIAAILFRGTKWKCKITTSGTITVTDNGVVPPGVETAAFSINRTIPADTSNPLAMYDTINNSVEALGDEETLISLPYILYPPPYSYWAGSELVGTYTQSRFVTVSGPLNAGVISARMDVSTPIIRQSGLLHVISCICFGAVGFVEASFGPSVSTQQTGTHVQLGNLTIRTLTTGTPNDIVIPLYGPSGPSTLGDVTTDSAYSFDALWEIEESLSYRGKWDTTTGAPI